MNALWALVPALLWTSAYADEATLQSAAALSGRYFGAALDPGDFDEKPYADLASRQLGAVTPENQMKWASVEPCAEASIGAAPTTGRFRQIERAEDPRPHPRLALAIAALVDQRRVRAAELQN